MPYLFVQIGAWLVSAAIIGGIAGWILRAVTARRSQAATARASMPGETGQRALLVAHGEALANMAREMRQQTSRVIAFESALCELRAQLASGGVSDDGDHLDPAGTIPQQPTERSGLKADRSASEPKAVGAAHSANASVTDTDPVLVAQHSTASQTPPVDASTSSLSPAPPTGQGVDAAPRPADAGAPDAAWETMEYVAVAEPSQAPPIRALSTSAGLGSDAVSGAPPEVFTSAVPVADDAEGARWDRAADANRIKNGAVRGGEAFAHDGSNHSPTRVGTRIRSRYQAARGLAKAPADKTG